MFPTRTTEADDAKVFWRLEAAPVHEGWAALLLRQLRANARIESFWAVGVTSTNDCPLAHSRHSVGR
jgi:hypothetical protein